MKTKIMVVDDDPNIRELVRLYQMCIRDRINAQQSALAARQGKIAEYISLLREQGLITEFNERLWYATVDQVRVLADGRLRFIFRDGTRIEG